MDAEISPIQAIKEENWRNPVTYGNKSKAAFKYDVLCLWDLWTDGFLERENKRDFVPETQVVTQTLTKILEDSI